MDRNIHSTRAFSQAVASLKAGNNADAARWCRIALEVDPNNVDAWLMLGGLSKDKARLAYIKEALDLDPTNKTARKAMHWAITKHRQKSESPSPNEKVFRIQKPSKKHLLRKKPALVPWIALFGLIVLGAVIWFFTPMISYAYNNPPQPQSQVAIEKATSTPTFTPTYTPTPTLTFTPTPTNTPTSTPTYTPSPTATETNTPLPTATFLPSSTPIPVDPDRPPDVAKGERWIDIDLTQQRLYAYEGKNLVNSFLVSTGTWQTPTVTGQYRIYVKYRYTDMSGPGYYLADVPYTMYFYKGYGIHGTYWHNNFGTPMSHGCVNMITADAGWVFNWASVGTLVNVHY